MSDMWKSDSVYTLRVLSEMVGKPRAGVMSSRSLRKAVMSKASSSLMLIVSGTSSQSAFVIPLPIVTIEDHKVRITSSLKPALVSTGSTESRIASADIVACRHGDVLFVMIENEYLSTIGFARAVRDEDKAPLMYMS